MKQVLLLAIACCSLLVGYAQDEEEFNYYEDYANILNGAQSMTSKYYFPDLYHKFQNDIENMSSYEVVTMTASFTGTNAYKPSKTRKLENRIIYAVDQKKHQLAYETAQEILAYNPINLTALCALEYAHYQLNGDSLNQHSKQIYMLLHAIEFSGDGTENQPHFTPNYLDYLTYFRMTGMHITHVSGGKDANGNRVSFYGYDKDGEYLGIKYFYTEHMMDKAGAALKIDNFAKEWEKAAEKEENK